MNIQNGEKDINDIFEDLLFSEEKLIEKGFEEGFKQGVLEGSPEGFHLGYHRGSELGAEVGYYSGIIESYKEYYKRQELNNKIGKTISSLESLIAKIPKHNDENVDIIELLNEIRANFKKFCAQIKYNLGYPELDNLSF